MWVASSASGHAKCYGVQGAKGMIECRNHCGYVACEHVTSAYCSTGSREVTIDNAEENEVVLSLFGKLSTEEASLDGMQLSTRSLHANWATGQPQKPSAGTWCAVIQSNGLWASRGCSEKAVCLCQFNLPSPPSPPPSPYTPPSTASPPPLAPPESTDSGDADVVLPVAIAGGSIAAVMAAIICVVFLRRRRRDNLLNSGQVVSERAVRESHPVIAPDGDVSLATKTTP